MIFISLGSGCQIKKNCDKFLNLNQETNLFDWVIVNFKTILTCLIKEKFVQEEFQNKALYYNYKYHWRYPKIPKNKNWIKTNELVENKNMLFICVHDIKKNQYKNSINDFINKINRRLERFKNLIKYNNKINFIHCINQQFSKIYTPDEADIINFYNLIIKLNKNCTFILNILIHPEHKDELKIKDLLKYSKKYNYLNIYILEYNNSICKRIDFLDSNLNWKDFFDNLKK